MMTSRREIRKHRKRQRTRYVRMAGWLLVAVGAVVLGRIPVFYIRSWWVGTHLARAALANLHTPDRAAGRRWPRSVQSVLEIPALQLTAPVVQGIQTAQLNIAAGHLPTSVEPGQPGTSIVAAHNVTWFRHINRLKPGATIRVLTPHTTLVFRVATSRVVHVGTPVANTPNASLVLEACYPLNALYLTPYRYLVFANFTEAIHRSVKAPAIPLNTRYAPQGIPTPVKDQGLTLATNDLPMGQLQIIGHPAAAWRQSNAPLNGADATTTLFFAALHILQQGNAAWWQALAPSIPFHSLSILQQSRIAHFTSLADESEWVTGTHLRQTQLVVSVMLATPSGTWPYRLTATMTVSRQHRVRLQSFHATLLTAPNGESSQ